MASFGAGGISLLIGSTVHKSAFYGATLVGYFFVLVSLFLSLVLAYGRNQYYHALGCGCASLAIVIALAAMMQRKEVIVQGHASSTALQFTQWLSVLLLLQGACLFTDQSWMWVVLCGVLALIVSWLLSTMYHAFITDG